MTQSKLTGIAAITALAFTAAMLMSADAPATTRALAIVPHDASAAGPADFTDSDGVGRLVLTFEPAARQIDRN